MSRNIEVTITADARPLQAQLSRMERQIQDQMLRRTRVGRLIRWRRRTTTRFVYWLLSQMPAGRAILFDEYAKGWSAGRRLR